MDSNYDYDFWYEYEKNTYNNKVGLSYVFHKNKTKKMIELIKKYDDGGTILDVGCGSGFLYKQIIGFKEVQNVYCCDIVSKAIAEIKLDYPYAKAFVYDLTTSKIDMKFNTVICSETLEHIDNHIVAIQNLKSLSAENGILIITVPNETMQTFFRFLIRRKPYKLPCHLHSFTPKIIKKLVGWKCIYECYLPYGFPMEYLMVFKNDKTKR